MVGALLLSMCVQMVSGLVIAGTDLYYPPLGQYFAESIAVDSNKLDQIRPYSKENVNEKAYKQCAKFESLLSLLMFMLFIRYYC
jgi:Ni/Fe-hydrogenase 1 B-type cytochrome subunit